jgi:CO/xanthine dehydrogenase Mo-binding subunit
VTGSQRYTADLRLEHALHVKLVHLDCARARILSVDRQSATEIPGVRCILTADDLPQPVARYGPNYADRPILAVGETKFFGEPVVAIAAETRDAAEAAAAAVRIGHDELPPVLTIDQARDPASPLVQDPAIRPNDRLAHTNTLKEWNFGWGNVDRANADCVIENVYTFPMVTHFAIEPHAFLAAPDHDGVTIWSPVQHPYILQRVVAGALRWPISKVRIIAPDPGGGFGGKGWPKVEPLMALLALRTGRPVRLVLTLEETFQAVRRASAHVRSRTGFSRDGRIVFQDIETDFLIGAYADVGARVVSKASYVACGPYRVPNARIVARALLSHTTPSTAFRGFGTPQASWAFESQLNEAAATLGIDRVEIRRRNLPERGEAFVPNDTPADGEWRQALDEAASRIGWGGPRTPHRGRGISLGLKSSATTAASSAIVRLHGDASASVLSGTSDMGQGARTIFTQIVADELGIAPSRIVVIMGDTAVVPFDTSTSASRSTVFMGNAIVKACRHVKAQLEEMAREVFEDQRHVAVEGGVVRVGETVVAYEDFLQQYWGQPRGEVVGLGSVRVRQHPEHPLGGRAAFWEFMAAAADVEVDVETGMVQIRKLVLVSDVGKALNPQQVESQDEGAAVMGLGHTLMEQLLLDERGRIRNLGALDYRIPTIQDVALQLESVLIENEDGPGPYGAKGAGEGGILAIASAVGSAIAEATGVIIRDLPLTPERIWTALQSGGEITGER